MYVYEEVSGPPRRRGASKKHSLAIWAKQTEHALLALILFHRERERTTHATRIEHARTRARTDRRPSRQPHIRLSD